MGGIVFGNNFYTPPEVFPATAQKKGVIFRMERVRRIELLSSAWKAVIIPLYYTRSGFYAF